MTSNELLDSHIEEAETQLKIFRDEIAFLTKEQLNWKYDTRIWTIGEILDHLVIFNGSYFPIIEKAIHATKDKPEFADVGENYMHTLTGNMMIKTVRPENRNRSSAPKLFHPYKTIYDYSITDKFEAQLTGLIRFMGASKGLNLALVRAYSPAIKILKFNLGDCYVMMVLHTKRHIEQMMRLAANTGFPKS